MGTIDYSNIICPIFKLKRIAYFGTFKYISTENIELIIKNSNGTIAKSFMDNTIDYIIFSTDAYFRYMKKFFKPFEDIEYIYNHLKSYNHLYKKIEIISEKDMLKLCNISDLENIFPKYIGKHLFNPISDYIVLDMISTGFDYNLDNIIKISALKIINNSISDVFVVDIKQSKIKNDYVINVVRGCISKPLIIYSLEEAIIRYISFINDLPILSCNTLLKNNLIFYCYNRITMKCINNDYIDIFQLMSNLYPNIKKINLDSTSKKLKQNLDYTQLSSIEWCTNVHYAYQTIIKKLNFKDTSNFKLNYFINKTFVLEGIFESMSRECLNDTIIYFGGKISKTVSASVDYLLLSNLCYFNYLNGKKTKKQITADSLMMNGTKINIISENTIKNILYYNITENNINDNRIEHNSLLDLLCY